MNPSVDALRRALLEVLGSEPERLGVGVGPHRITYVPNAGGFVNASFTVEAPSGAVHIKLAGREDDGDLERWWRHRERLTRQYRAPRMTAWLAPERSDLRGTVMEHLVAGRARWPEHRAIWPVVWDTVATLHADTVLRTALLREGAVVPTYAEVLETTYLEMVVADVAGTRAHPEAPPFVASDLWDWALAEVAELRRRIRSDPAFRHSAREVVHGDLWPGNVLVAGPDDSRWWIVDWDDFGLGDPAKDLVDWWWQTGSEPADLSWDLASRLPLWRRARLLVDAVDPLADWAEAVVAPVEHRDPMREAAQAVHEDALARYRREYGS